MPSFGEELVEWRKRHNLTQSEAADALEVSGTTVSNWETGATTPRPNEQARVKAAMDRYDQERKASSDYKLHPDTTVVHAPPGSLIRTKRGPDYVEVRVYPPGFEPPEEDE